MPRVAATGPKPWEVEGVSKSKFYRDKRGMTTETKRRKKLRAVGPKRRGRPPGSKNKKPQQIGNGVRRGRRPVDPVAIVDRALVNEFLAQSAGMLDNATIHAFSGAACNAIRRILKHHGYGYDA